MYPSTLEPVTKPVAKLVTKPVTKPVDEHTLLTANVRVVDVDANLPPVVVVGLPRSGSSYLSHVLSCLDDWFIFDDLYPYQKAASLGLSSSTNLANQQDVLKEFVNQLGWQLRSKIKFEENFDVPELTLEDTFAMEQALYETLCDSPSLTWPQVTAEWMTRLARHSGKHRWGYKTPQDFMHMDELTDVFPGIKFIYILRDPRKVMRSFKNLPRVKTHGSEDGESRQYHPLVYSLYWKTAYDKVQAFKDSDRAPVEIVKFEDLVKTPEAIAQRLSEFLNTRVSRQVVSGSVNSSFNQGQNEHQQRNQNQGRRHLTACELTHSEIALCEKIAGTQMQSAGYELAHPTPQLLDAVDMVKTSVDFTAYQLHRMLTCSQGRASIAAFVKNLV